MNPEQVKDDICQAISERKVIQFYYKNKPRVAEPYICGESFAGKYVLLAFQTGGYSSSRKFGWKLFELTSMANLKITETEFNVSGEERRRYNPIDPRIKKTFCCIPKT
jgi:hypothetical protein